MPRRQPAVLHRGRAGRELHELLGDPARRLRLDEPPLALDLLLARGRPDEDALAAGLARRLDDQLGEPRQHVLALLGVVEHVGPHVVEDRLLAQVVADHLRHVVVDRLVVGDPRPDRVDDRDRARAVGAHQSGHAEHRIGPELEWVDERVVEAAVDGVHALEPVGGADEAQLVADHEVGGLDELDAHLAREERVLEVGRVERARRPHHHGRLAVAGGRDLAQRVEQQHRVVVDRPHAVGGEEPGQQARHRAPVLEHVGDPARRADVVLQHLPGAVGVAHEVAAGDVAVDAAGRPDAVGGARELRPRDDQRPRHDAVVHDLAPVVDVVDEAVERPDPLREPALDRAPLVHGEDPRHEVERERAVDRGVAVGAADLEGDALAHEDRVAPMAGLDQALVPERLERGGQRRRVGARRAAAVVHLVVVRHPRDPARRETQPHMT